MQQHARALDMAQETVSEPGAVGRAFDQAGDVGDDQLALVAEVDDTEVRDQRGEGVVGDLGARARHARDEGRLADVGKAEQADVGQELELEPERALLAGRPGGGDPRGAVPCGGEVDVALAALAAARGDEAGARRVEIEQPLAAVDVMHDGADRHPQDELLAALAVLILVAAVLPALRLVVAAVLVVEERRELRVGDDHHAAAVAAVAARRSAARNVRLAPEGDAAVAAVARLHVNGGLVDEVHGPLARIASLYEAAGG